MTYILIFIAAFSNAIMDTLRHHFDKSVFKNLNQQFWNAAVSHTNKYKNGDSKLGRKYPKCLSPLTDIFSDAWHIFKIIMIVAIIIGFSITKQFQFSDLLIHWAIWFATFEIFYSHILISKK